MGRETEAPAGNAANGNMFDKVIAMRLKKRVEQYIVDVIDEMDIDDDGDLVEVLNEIMVSIFNDNGMKARIKARVNEIIEKEDLIEKVSLRIVNKLLKE